MSQAQGLGERAIHAAMRPALSDGRRFVLWLTVFGVPVVLAVAAYITQLVYGLGVTGLTNQFFWGSYETNLVTFIGLSYGGALSSAILRLTGAHWRAPITRIAEAVALVTLLIGSVFALVHLGRPERVWQFFTWPNISSPIVWDFLAINTYLIATIVVLYLPMIPDLAECAETLPSGFRRWVYSLLSRGWQGTPLQHRVLDQSTTAMSIMIIPIAITVHSVLAWAFAVHVRVGWHSSIYGPYFVIGALYSGVAMVILAVAAYRRVYRLEGFITEVQFRNLGYLLLTLGPLYLYFTFSDLLTESYVLTAEGRHLLDMLFLSTYAPLFWSFVVLGIVVPTLLVAIRRTRTISGIVVASALVVASMWLKRFLIIVPTLAVPLVEEASHPHTYVPSGVEIAIALGALFSVPVLLMVFFRVFPVLSLSELREATAEEHAAAPQAARSSIVRKGA